MSTSAKHTVRKYDRPNGMSIEPYVGALKWSNSHWAWEFLRRSEDFQRETSAAKDASRAEQKRVSKQFGLLAFKDYREDYLVASGKPRFEITRLRARLANADNEPSQNVLNLRPGELGLALRVDSLASDIAIRSALGRIERAIRRRVPAEQKQGPAKRTKASDLIEMLRILDAEAAGKSSADMARAIYPRELKGRDGDAAREHMKERRRRARRLADEGYIALANYPEKLDVKPSAELRAALEKRQQAR